MFRQHGETVRRYDQTRKELEYYRSQNQVMINQIEQAAQESSSLRAKLAVEKQFERSQQVLFVLKYKVYFFLNQ